MWGDIVMIMISCVMSNHLGLVGAMEDIVRHKIPIVNCVKCFTFWATFGYCIFSTHDIIMSFAISFPMAFLALFFDLALGLIDNLYYYAYDWVYGTKATVCSDDGNNGVAATEEASDEDTEDIPYNKVSEVWIKIMNNEKFE